MYAFDSQDIVWEVRLQKGHISLINEYGRGFAIPYSGEWENDLRQLTQTVANQLFHDAYNPTMIEVTELAPRQDEIDRQET